MGNTVSANGWPPIHGFGHVRVTAVEPFVESAKSLYIYQRWVKRECSEIAHNW